jgi:acyl-CoA reductase-like NAD-dependent aldehyde dehydrogenase
MKMLINGKWEEAVLKGEIAVFNPATHELIDHVPLGTKEDIFKAVEYAKTGYKINRAIPAKGRYEYLVKAGNLILKNLEELRETMILENGKPWHWADFEIKKSA